MRRRPSPVLLAVSSWVLVAATASGAGWTPADERRMAADAASFAPPDFKRQLAKHSRRLMQGVNDAAAAPVARGDAAARRADGARGARALAEAIRRHTPFDEIAYRAGGIVHVLALANAPEGATPRDASLGARFLGFPAEPFAPPETLAAAALPSNSAREKYDATVTLVARLLAWVWKTAGGDASIVAQYPAAKGPYDVRE
jgi:hypothetical protein